MTAVFPLDGRGHAAESPAHIDHVLDCAAGFFLTQAEAMNAVARLRQTRGLLPDQLLLLGPPDAAWLPFRRLARQWARGLDALGQSWQNDPRLVALLGAVLALPLTVFALLLVEDLTQISAGVLAIALVLTGAAGGAAVASHRRRSRRYQKFDQLIRDEMTAGHWVVVAHDVAWASQASMLSVLRDGSTNWCAISSAQRGL